MLRRIFGPPLRNGLNGVLKIAGLEVVAKKPHDWGDVKQFIPFEETLAGAREAGLTVGAYIDVKHNAPGVSQDTHNRLVELGIFKDPIERVCEIGPGSGRFLEKTVQACKPSHYEIYETAKPWADWLVATYKVIPQVTDGISLSQTPTSSIDLVQAHKVFVCMLFLTTCNYFQEISRVTKPGAWVVFDVMTEGCMDGPNVEAWLKTGINSRTYPAIIPRSFVIDLFQRNGFNFVSSFLVPMKPGKTELMIFKKKS
jgi:hypothetical protein